jgi:CRISPR-associated protein Csb2
MAFTIEVELVRAAFEAGRFDAASDSEWPPAPARLFCALVAPHETEGERNALRWLENQGAPNVECSTARESHRTNYVPTNQSVAGSHHNGFDARTAKGPRTWYRHRSDEPVVRFTWPTAVPDDETIHAIEGLCRKVPYLGRSTSPAIVSVLRAEEAIHGLQTFTPDETGRTRFTVPSPGYLDALVNAYETERSAWEVPRRFVAYRTGAAVAPAVGGPWEVPIVLPFAHRRSLAAAHLVLATTTLRRALINALDGGPTVLHGHADGSAAPRHQISFLGVPVVGNPHADGHLVGMAIALPRDVTSEDRRAILRGLRQVRSLHLGKVGSFELERTPDTRQALNPDRWSRKSRMWVSATPMCTDRHLHRTNGTEFATAVRDACRHIDLPEPVSVDASEFPLLLGAQNLSPHQRVRRMSEKAKSALHCRITFAEEVGGPLVLGNMRSFGLGLMLPEWS